jgi:hypothetical protein
MQEGLHAPGIGWLNIYIWCILKYSDAGGASCPRNRRVKY